MNDNKKFTGISGISLDLESWAALGEEDEE
jgi:hypothetical protein